MRAAKPREPCSRLPGTSHNSQLPRLFQVPMIEHGLRRSRAANLSASLIAIVTFAVALGMDFRPQFPVVPHASGAAPVRGGFGLDPAPRVWLAWSSPAEANA